jgi:hypothetical protein
MHLTNNEPNPHSCGAASDFSEVAGAPADIEITPEMIKAGAYELGMFDSEYDSFEEGAERIFSVMLDMMKTSQSCD